MLSLELFRPCINNVLPLISKSSFINFSVNIEQLKQLHTLSLEDTIMKKGVFFLGSECSSQGLLSLWLISLLVPAVNSFSSPPG